MHYFPRILPSLKNKTKKQTRLPGLLSSMATSKVGNRDCVLFGETQLWQLLHVKVSSNTRGLFQSRVLRLSKQSQAIFRPCLQFLWQYNFLKNLGSILSFASRQFCVPVNTNLHLKLFPKLEIFYISLLSFLLMTTTLRMYGINILK